MVEINPSGFSIIWTFTSRTYLSRIRLTNPNTRLDLAATHYPNTRCSMQQTPIVGVLRKNSTNKWWFVQFPQEHMPQGE